MTDHSKRDFEGEALEGLAALASAASGRGPEVTPPSAQVRPPPRGSQQVIAENQPPVRQERSQGQPRLPSATPQLIPEAETPQRRRRMRPEALAAGRAYSLPPLRAMASNHQKYGAHIAFALCVLLPIFFATIYFGLMASNQYVAEFRFAVKDATPGTNAAASPLLALVGGSGGSSNDNYIVVDYLTSRQAIEELQTRINVRGLYSKDEADWWMRFNPSQPMEKFLIYWQGMVKAHYDQVTGIAVAQVRAFTAEDALLIANSMVTLSEELVNKIASRSQTDAVRFAQREVDRAEARLKDIRAKLSEYRIRAGVIDPNASVVLSNSTLTQTLRATVSQLETQLATLITQNLQPNSPAVMVLKNQIKATKDQLESTEASVGQTRNGTNLSAVVAEYEQLDLERQFSQLMLTSTMQALDQARASAASQHLYITPYIRPSMPQSSTYPRRFFSIAMVGLLAFVFWVIGLLMVRSIRERFA